MQRLYILFHQMSIAISPENIAVTIITFEEQVRGRFNIIRQANSADKLVIAYSRLEATYNFFIAFLSLVKYR